MAVLLSKYLAHAGYTVLAIDADPQSNLTTFLKHTVEPDQPTLLELYRKQVSLEDATYPTEIDNLYLIPSDDGLDQVQDYLASSGIGALSLGKRLAPASEAFDMVVIDSPPQRSQICKSIIGAAHQVVIPCEATVKGYGSLVRTVEAIRELKEDGVSEAEVLGVIPFRDRWVGRTRTKESEMVIREMAMEVGEKTMLPSIRESEKYKQAISQGVLLEDLGAADLAYPFEALIERIQEVLK
ncbi:MAG: ParA family protein [Marinobacter sp.]|nr:ParA family protein [Marinobacter sp.]MDX5472825.1 ParA family protein [Marinobacter sp.]